MIRIIGKHKRTNNGLLELSWQFNKVAGYKITTQNSAPFLCIRLKGLLRKYLKPITHIPTDIYSATIWQLSHHLYNWDISRHLHAMWLHSLAKNVWVGKDANSNWARDSARALQDPISDSSWKGDAISSTAKGQPHTQRRKNGQEAKAKTVPQRRRNQRQGCRYSRLLPSSWSSRDLPDLTRCDFQNTSLSLLRYSLPSCLSKFVMGLSYLHPKNLN